MKFTFADLKQNSEAYERNFEMLVKTVGTLKHKKYVIREQELNRRDKQIRYDLGMTIYDPCPLVNPEKNCENCSGWIKRDLIRRSMGLIEAKAGKGELCTKNNS